MMVDTREAVSYIVATIIVAVLMIVLENIATRGGSDNDSTEP